MNNFDSVGHVIETHRPSDSTLRLGMEWKAGIYIVDVVQCLNRKTIKLMKQ